MTVTNNSKLFPKKIRFTICQRMQNITLTSTSVSKKIFSEGRSETSGAKN